MALPIFIFARGLVFNFAGIDGAFWRRHHRRRQLSEFLEIGPVRSWFHLCHTLNVPPTGATHKEITLEE